MQGLPQGINSLSDHQRLKKLLIHKKNGQQSPPHTGTLNHMSNKLLSQRGHCHNPDLQDRNLPWNISPWHSCKAMKKFLLDSALLIPAVMELFSRPSSSNLYLKSKRLQETNRAPATMSLEHKSS